MPNCYYAALRSASASSDDNKLMKVETELAPQKGRRGRPAAKGKASDSAGTFLSVFLFLLIFKKFMIHADLQVKYLKNNSKIIMKP